MEFTIRVSYMYTLDILIQHVADNLYMTELRKDFIGILLIGK